MALSPIMTLPRLHYCLVVFAFNLVFYTHMRMHNAPYISFHHVEFYFRLRQLMAFLVWGQLYWDCQGEESSTIISVISINVICLNFGTSGRRSRGVAFQWVQVVD